MKRSECYSRKSQKHKNLYHHLKNGNEKTKAKSLFFSSWKFNVSKNQYGSKLTLGKNLNVVVDSQR